jgi:hypothetical protein
VERGRVPGFVAGFDVCIVPFKVDEVSVNVSPLKAYEYLAMGKPVVSVPMPSLEADPVAKGVTFVTDHRSFVDAVRTRLDEGSGNLHLPQEMLREAGWDGRFETVRATVEPLLGGEPD